MDDPCGDVAAAKGGCRCYDDGWKAFEHRGEGMNDGPTGERSEANVSRGRRRRPTSRHVQRH